MNCPKCKAPNRSRLHYCAVCGSTLYGFEHFLKHGTRNPYGNKEQDIKALNQVLDASGLKVDRVIDGLTMIQYRIMIGDADVKTVMKQESKVKLALRTESVRMFVDYSTREIVIEKEGARNIVRLGDLYNDKFIEASGLPVMLGKDAQGNNLYTDLTKAPHMLVAGCTGSGKSIFLHSLICSVLMKNHRTEIYGIDPKGTEFKKYSPLPTFHYVTETGDAVRLLKRLCNVMDERYHLLTKHGYRDIDDAKNGGQNMERIIVVIDEFADLMECSNREVEPYVVRIAQKARACGIHLVIATQYPIVKYVTGAIKANIPYRVALQVNSNIESRVILDQKGAEDLLGHGDMFFVGKSGKPIRIQGCFVDEMESIACTAYEMEYGKSGKVKYYGLTA